MRNTDISESSSDTLRSVFHKPVLTREVMENLGVVAGKTFIDATLGDAGHTIEIARRGGRVLGIDRDEDAVKRATNRLVEEELGIRKRIELVKGNFSAIKELAKKKGFDQIDGILFDLGVSTYQLTTGERGFSVNRDGPLDMRMDQSQDLSAFDIVNSFSEESLYAIFTRNAQEHNSRTFAHAIVVARTINGPIQTTQELAEIVLKVVRSGRHARIHPATRIFQAIRMEVNQERSELLLALPKAVDILVPGGKIAVISFHSGEDRIIKQFFQSSQDIKPLHKHVIQSSEQEMKENNRSRSARLRIAEKL